MARFLITTWHFPGHLYPQIAIAHALHARGHEVAFYSGPGTAGILATEGFRLFPFRSLSEAHVEQVLFTGDRAAAHPRAGHRYAEVMRRWMVDTIPAQVSDLESILRDFQPDAIASDQTMWAPIFVFFERNECPVAITSCGAFCLIPGPGVPPFGLGLPRVRNLRTRLVSETVRVACRLAAGSFVQSLNRIRHAYGLAPVPSPVLSHLSRLPLYVVPSSPEFDHGRTGLPPSVQYVGPLSWNKPSGLQLPDWFGDLRRDRPWIHATEGTVHFSEPAVLRAVAQGLAGSPVEVILTSGASRDPAGIDLGTRAANVHVARWIPHSELLPGTAVMITTGGAGSVLAAIEEHVPLIVIPTEWDKPEIAQRVVENGAGVRIEPSRVNPQTIRCAVERLLGDGFWRFNASRLAYGFRALGGAPRAALLLEQLAVKNNQTRGRLQHVS